MPIDALESSPVGRNKKPEGKKRKPKSFTLAPLTITRLAWYVEKEEEDASQVVERSIVEFLDRKGVPKNPLPKSDTPVKEGGE